MKKGMSGIGVLIIFIAMILVAAVAAMVLLQTVGSLEGQALQTGKESTGEVSTKLRITSITGVTDNVENPVNISYLRIVSRLAPGSRDINLNHTLMEFMTSVEQANGLYYNMSPSNTASSAQASTQRGSSYSLVYLGQDAALPNSRRIAITQNDIVEIWYETTGIPASTEAKVTLTPTQGALESIPFRTPSSYAGQYVKLFP